MCYELLVVQLLRFAVEPFTFLVIGGALHHEAGHPQRKAHHVCGLGPHWQALLLVGPVQDRGGNGVDEDHREKADDDPDCLDLPEYQETARLSAHLLETRVFTSFEDANVQICAHCMPFSFSIFSCGSNAEICFVCLSAKRGNGI